MSATKAQNSRPIPIVSPVQQNDKSQHLLHVSMDSRDIGKAPLQMNMSSKSHLPSLSTTKAQNSRSIPIMSPVQQSGDSQHLLHVSMDSRDMGKAPLHRKIDTRSSYKSYMAPSFDEAASFRSRMYSGESLPRREQTVIEFLDGGGFVKEIYL